MGMPSGGEQVDRARRGTGLNGVDDDRPIEADHPLHQPQPAPVVLGDLDVGPIGQQRLQFLDHPQADAVVGHQRIAEAEDEGFHGRYDPSMRSARLRCRPTGSRPGTAGRACRG